MTSFPGKQVLIGPDMILPGKVRQQMKQFWQQVGQRGATEIEMLLDEQASTIGQLEVPEVLGLLPDVDGKDVLELGSGIGSVMVPLYQQYIVKFISALLLFPFFILLSCMVVFLLHQNLSLSIHFNLFQFHKREHFLNFTVRCIFSIL